MVERGGCHRQEEEPIISSTSYLLLELRPTSKAEVEWLLNLEVNIYQFPGFEQLRKTMLELFVLGSLFHLSKITGLPAYKGATM